VKKAKKGQISFIKFVKITVLKLKFHKVLEICSDSSKTGLKIYYFSQHSKKAKAFYFWQTVSKKGQIWQIWPLKSPNGNPEM
jgi:hypothetical protein